MFFNLFNFFTIFLEFSITGRVGADQNDNFIFIISRAFPTYFGLKEAIMEFFDFLEFPLTSRAGTNRNDNFYFLSFSVFYNLF